MIKFLLILIVTGGMFGSWYFGWQKGYLEGQITERKRRKDTIKAQNEENNYESKGGYCAVCTGILAGGACTMSEIHERLLDSFIRTKLTQEREAGRKEIIEKGLTMQMKEQVKIMPTREIKEIEELAYNKGREAGRRERDNELKNGQRK